MQSDVSALFEAAAGVSGAVLAATAVYPLDVVKTRLIVESLSNSGKPAQGIMSCLLDIAQYVGAHRDEIWSGVAASAHNHCVSMSVALV